MSRDFCPHTVIINRAAVCRLIRCQLCYISFYCTFIFFFHPSCSISVFRIVVKWGNKQVHFPQTWKKQRVFSFSFNSFTICSAVCVPSCVKKQTKTNAHSLVITAHSCWISFPTIHTNCRGCLWSKVICINFFMQVKSNFPHFNISVCCFIACLFVKVMFRNLGRLRTYFCTLKKVEIQ